MNDPIELIKVERIITDEEPPSFVKQVGFIRLSGDACTELEYISNKVMKKTSGTG